MKLKTPGGTQAAIDEAEFRRGLDVLIRDGEREAVEFRALPSGRAAVVSPMRDDDDILAAVRELPLDGQLYFGINPPRSDLAGSAKKGDILKRVWLFLDVDPTRGVKDASATDEEKAAAWSVMTDMVAEMGDANWPNPVIVDSGNGYHAYYRIHLTNDTESQTLLKRCLLALAARFDTDAAKVDRAVHDAPRVAKMPGSTARKGPNSPARPHRPCRIISVPAETETVSREQLEGLAAEAPKAAAPRADAKAPLSGRLNARTPGGAPTARGMALRCLAKSAERVRSARSVDDHGTGRNPQLNRELWLCARFIQDGMLTEGEIVGELVAAARSTGTPGIEPTLNSSWRSNIGNPHGMWVPSDEPPQRAGTETPRMDNGKGDEPAWQLTVNDVVKAEGDPADVLDAVSVKGADESTRRTRSFHVRTMRHLMKTEFPVARWLIEGIMSEGLNLLVGSPKQGKSILALNLALTIAGGGTALGVPVTPADVLYLSLEDQDRRVQGRARKMMAGMPAAVSDACLDRLSVVTTWPRQDEDGLRMMEGWIQDAANPGLVIIDVWNRFAPAYEAKGSAYRQDADAVSEVKQWCDRHRVAGLIVHHDRKVQGGGKAEDDFVASISGTQGIAGSADGIMVLVRNRNETAAELKITGRDVEERSLSLEFNKDALTWRYVGASDKVMSGKVQLKIVDFLKRRGSFGATGPEVSDGIGEDKDSVRKALGRMLTDKVVSRRGNTYLWPFDDGETAAEV